MPNPMPNPNPNPNPNPYPNPNPNLNPNPNPNPDQVGTINAAPVRQRRRTADFSWGVHAHHFFTVLLCALGTNLPASLVDEGAVCILLGEVHEP